MKKIIVLFVIGMTFTTTSATASARTERHLKDDSAAKIEQVSPEKKKVKSFFLSVFTFLDKIGTTVQNKYRQNERAIEDAEKGIHRATHRQLASDPTARRVQEKLEKITQEKINKYDSVGE